jgi:hypothetical protein
VWHIPERPAKGAWYSRLDLTTPIAGSSGRATQLDHFFFAADRALSTGSDFSGNLTVFPNSAALYTPRIIRTDRRPRARRSPAGGSANRLDEVAELDRVAVMPIAAGSLAPAARALVFAHLLQDRCIFLLRLGEIPRLEVLLLEHGRALEP